MGSSKKQTVGYRYRAGLMVAIGSCIERVLDINPGETGWQFSSKQEQETLKAGDVSIKCDKPNIFGGDNKEGGWVGTIDIHTGKPHTARKNEYLKRQIDENVSAYPRLSYLVFRGGIPVMGTDPFGNQYIRYIPSAFQLVSMSGMMKDFLLWVKRTCIKSDGSPQWFQEINGKIVCEIDGSDNGNAVVIEPTPLGTVELSAATNWQNKNNPAEMVSGSMSIVRDVVGDFGAIYPKNPKYEYANYISNVPFVTHFTFTFGGSGIVEIDVPVIKGNFGGRDPNSIQHSFTSNFPFFLDEKKSTDSTKLYTITAKGGSTVTGSVSVDLYPEPPPFYWFFNHRIGNISFRQKEEIIIPNPHAAMDINPVHKIREILTDYEAMSKPESDINDDNFKAAAERIYDERLGISWAVTEKSCKEALDELLYHIEAGLRVNRQTGKYEIVLFRDDLTTPVANFTTSNMKSFNVDIANADDLTNTVNVHFYDRENIKNASFALSDVGGVLTAGRENTETVDFPYFMQKYNAEKVGNWKLKQLATPLWRGSFKTGDYDARKLNRYDVITISYPDLNIISLRVRIMKISLGDGIDNTVTIDFIEITEFSSLDYSEIGIDDFEHTPQHPQKSIQKFIEAPYFELVQRFGERVVGESLSSTPDLGYVQAMASIPQSNSINAELWTDVGTMLYTETQYVAPLDYCATAELDGAINEIEDIVKIKNMKNIDKATIGTYIVMNGEILVYLGYQEITGGIMLKRGALDTIPTKHSSGTLFFSGEFSAIDPNEYTQGDRISGQVLTRTPTGLLDLSVENQIGVVLNSRAFRPYPPAYVTINNLVFPDSINGDITLNWLHRNRVQQTGGDILGWYDGGVTVESGVTYFVRLTNMESFDTIFESDVGLVDHFQIASEDLFGARRVLIEVYSFRDGYSCLFGFKHEVAILSAFTAPYNLVGVYSNA